MHACGSKLWIWIRRIYGIILEYGKVGQKNIFGLWLNTSKSKYTYTKTFDELKQYGVKEILFISKSGIRILDIWAKAIFKSVIAPICIFNLIWNFFKYALSKYYTKINVNLKLYMMN